MGSVAMTLAMFRCSSLILIFLSWTLVLAQNNNNKKLFGDEKKTPVKRGPDGRPLLFGPDIEKCNFQGKGCEGAIFDPINVNGWFWAGAGNTRMPPTNQPSQKTFWSHTGPEGKPQPDNFEGRAAGKLVSVSDPIGLTVEG